MSETPRLAQVEAQFNVVAPSGGYMRMLRSYDLGLRDSLRLEIDNLYGNGTFWIRVTPMREEVVLAPTHHDLYLINHAVANFIDPETDEELPGRHQVDVWLSINTSVTILGMPAGTLKMWDIPLDSTQIGA